MSADAKAWSDDLGMTWQGCHDGPCAMANQHQYPTDLVTLLREIEQCLGVSRMQWKVRVYHDGATGLVGWV